MNKSLSVVLIVIAVIVVAGALILVGTAIGRNAWAFAGGWPAMMTNGFLGQAGRFGGMGTGMMQRYGSGGTIPAPAPGAGAGWSRGGYGGGMMGWSSGGYGSGMMGSRGGYGSGMMGSGSGGMMSAGMMGYAGAASGLSNVEPLTLEQAEAAVQDYLDSLGDENLALGEIMIFDNHAYAQILEADTGLGAQEVLIDPVTLSVYPEHGPNMMWNQKYGTMAGHMGWLAGVAGSPEDMPVTAEEAVEKAQAYLADYLPGTAVDQADPFYGYYTLDILRDGAPIGMLSVNGYTGQVFVHTWHGDFVEMAEAE